MYLMHYIPGINNPVRLRRNPHWTRKCKGTAWYSHHAETGWFPLPAPG